MARKTEIITVVDKPTKSNAVGGKRYRVTQTKDGTYEATFGGRALLTIHPDDVVKVEDAPAALKWFL